MRRVGWRRPQCSFDHFGNLIVVDGSRAAGARLVKQAITAVLQKSATPLANGVLGRVRQPRTCLAIHPHTAGSRGTAQIGDLMVARQLAALILSDDVRTELQSLTMRRKTVQALALRAHIVLTCAEGQNNEVAAKLGLGRRTVGK
ncbi:hypothetical protein ACVW1C_005970 [Bradyrhizobium sp. USDA 4011]